MHTDKFNRRWRFTPGHDTNKMLRPNPAVVLAVLNLQRLRRGQELATPADIVDTEPYLLNQGRAWVFGMRYGNEGFEYYSPSLDDDLIQAMLVTHQATRSTLEELHALDELV